MPQAQFRCLLSLVLRWLTLYSNPPSIMSTYPREPSPAITNFSVAELDRPCDARGVAFGALPGGAPRADVPNGSLTRIAADTHPRPPGHPLAPDTQATETSWGWARLLLYWTSAPVSSCYLCSWSTLFLHCKSCGLIHTLM